MMVEIKMATVMDGIGSHQNSCVEVLTANVTIFGDEAFKGVINVNEVTRAGL